MSNEKEAQRRWNWINGWLTAALNACIESVGLSLNRNPTITSLIEQYSQRVLSKLKELSKELSKIPNMTIDNWEIEYVFHLEEELWGPDWENYINFFPTNYIKNKSSEILLQTFHFVLSFYIIERCLKLLIGNQRERYKLSRKSFRRQLFGSKEGLLSVKFPQVMGALGAPFFLAATTRRVEVVGACSKDWEELRKKPVPEQLKRFYRKTTGKDHFVDIIERALISTRNDHIRKTFQQGKRKSLPQGTRAYWYDVLWHYSESIRYNPILPSPISVEKPFFWNRTIRWFTSIAITAIFLIIQKKGAPISKIWKQYANRELGKRLGGNKRFEY